MGSGVFVNTLQIDNFSAKGSGLDMDDRNRNSEGKCVCVCTSVCMHGCVCVWGGYIEVLTCNMRLCIRHICL